MRSKNVVESIGNTPLVEIARMSPNKNVRIFAKLEGQNTGGSGSMKDRIARYMIEAAERDGKLTPDKTMIEATSGNTGIALSMIARRKGYKIKIVMPESMSVERRQILKLYGAELILSSAEGGVNGAVQVAQDMAAESDEYFVPDQFGNPANPLAHYETTGPEIIADMGALKIDVFIAGIGTGGTITGVGRRLRESYPSIKIIGVEPFVDDPVQGLRSLKAGFIPPIIDLSIMDARPEVSNKDASIAVVKLLQQEGIFAGISSGVVIHQAIKMASQMDSGNIVVVLPDGGFKYLSTNSYE